MNKIEAAKILAILKTAYPNTKAIEDPEAMAKEWEMFLQDYSAESVMKAVNFHIKTKMFFPTIAEIRENMVRAELVYKSTEIGKDLLQDNSIKRIGTPDCEEKDIDFKDLVDLEPSGVCLICPKLKYCYPDN